MSNVKEQYTKSQKEVVFHDNGNIVVTASAGSGKTKVMIDRFIRLIETGKASVDEVLAVTFTILSAQEFKERLAKAIKNMIATSKGAERERFKAELEKLPLAQISTVHSFCSQVIKRYFYLIDVEPSYSVLSEKDVPVLQKLALDDVFERLYEENDEDILLLLSSYVNKRSDRTLKEEILRIYKVVCAKIDIESYFDKSIACYTVEGEKKAINTFIERLFEKMSAAFDRLYSLEEEAKNLGLDKYVSHLDQLFADFEYLKNDLTEENILSFAKLDRKFSGVRISADDCDRIAFRKKFNDLKDDFKKCISKVKILEEIKSSPYELLREQKILKGFKKVVTLFDKEYSARKKELSSYDFNDLERFCYQILQNSDAREEIASTYKYLFVDEYQDTNEIQENIFSCLERDNLFVVGDVKQSIYAFRGSNPKLFLKRLEKEKNLGGTVKELETNFRSSKKVIDAVNKVFSRVMTSEVDIDYKSSPMVCGTKSPQKGEVVYHYFTKEKGEKTTYSGVYGVLDALDDAKESNKIGIEVLVRKIVEDSVGKDFIEVTKEGLKHRKIEYRDIAILTKRNSNGKFASELVKAGIPVISESQQHIKEYPEIVMLTNLLSLIATVGRDDIALITILKTVVGKISEKEMRTIRKNHTGDSFYSACKAYVKNNNDAISNKLKKFFDLVERLNLLSNFEGAVTLITRVFDETRLDMEILSTSLGEMRLKRVEAFLTALENGGNELTVNEFLSKKETILDDMTIAFSGAENAVKLLTIHKSKGLEFPVVILADIEGDMHSVNKRSEIILHNDLGILVMTKDPITKIKKQNAIRACALEEIDRAEREGEMRLLYVAMTRAILNLHIVGTKPLNESYHFAQVKRITDYFCQGDFESEEVLESELSAAQSQLEPRELIYADDSSSYLKEVEKYAIFTYPFEKDTSLDLKLSVTEANKKTDFLEESEKTRQLFSSTIDEGVLYHTFLENSSFNVENIDNEVIALLNSGKITQEDAKTLDKETLKKILSNEIFTLFSGYEKYPEQQFICHYPPSVLGLEGDNEVLVQGVIDLLLVKDGSAIIIDYKYSGVSKDVLVKRYEKQLKLYAYAVEKVLKLKVQRAILFNIKSQETIEII